MLIHRNLKMKALQKQISMKEYCKNKPIARSAHRLFCIFRSNIVDIQEIERQIFDLSNLVVDYIPHTIFEPMNRTIESLNKNVEAYHLTRFNKEQLQLLFVHLHLPSRFTVHKTHHFCSEFVLILSLTYLASAENLKSLTYKFGGNHDFWGLVFKEFIEHIYSTFYHKISGDSLRLLPKKKFEKYNSLIYDRVAFSSKEVFEYDNNMRDTTTEINIRKEQFRICGFIDDSNVRACRPGSGPINGGGKFSERRDRTEEGNDLQKAFYR
jgi:hypothetical protein